MASLNSCDEVKMTNANRDDQPDGDGNNALKALATTIRTLYWQNLRHFVIERTGQDPGTGARRCVQWDGGEDASGNVYASIWPEIAAHFRHHRLDAAKVIQDAFQQCPGCEPPPPSTLLDGRITAAALAERNALLAQMKLVLDIEKRTAESAIFNYQCNTNLSKQDIYSRVICSSLGLSPLFRFCLAVEVRLWKLAAGFRDRAIGQYAMYPDFYDELLPPGLIPAEFRAELGSPVFFSPP